MKAWFKKQFPFFSSLNGALFLNGCGIVLSITEGHLLWLSFYAILFYWGTLGFMFESWVKQQQINLADSEYAKLATKYNDLAKDREEMRLLILKMNELIPNEIRGDSSLNPAKELKFVP